MATIRTGPRTAMWALRISESEKAEIKARADRAGLSMGDYMIRSALGELDVEASGIEHRFSELEERVAQLERAAELGAYG